MTLRYIRSGLLISGVVLIATILAIELLVRLVLDPGVDLKRKPNASYTYVQREYTMRVQLNDRGFRDEPFGPAPPGAFRAIVLGDSFAFGWGVDVEETFPYLLEKLVGERLGRPAVFYNLATEGTNVDSYLEHLKRYGPELAPDLVLVAYFVGNDAVAQPHKEKKYPQSLSGWVWKYLNKLKLVRFVRTRRLKAGLTRRLGMEAKPRDIRGVRNPLLDIFASPDPSIQRKLAGLSETDVRDALEWRINPFIVEQAVLEPRLEEHMERQLAVVEDDPTTARTLEAIRDEASRLGARVACVLIPASFQVQPSAVEVLRKFGYEADGPLVEGTELMRSLGKVLDGLEVPTLNLAPILKSSKEETYFSLDGHFRPAGHLVSARAIVDFLARSGLLSSPPATERQ